MMQRPRRPSLLVAVLTALVACRREPGATSLAAGKSEPRPVVVYAAASLAAAFTELGNGFAQQDPRYALQFVFEGSPSLVLKLQQGALADVLATADQPNMDKVASAKLTAAPPAEFARNRLAIVVAKGNPKQITSLADLARADLRVALCGETVPAGRYARQALQKAKVQLKSLSDEASVAALCSKVHLGELDGGIAYVTDVKGKDLEAVAIAAEHDVVASYPIAVLPGKERAGGERFVAFVRSEPGRRILKDQGFLLP